MHDTINGTFELIAGILLWINVIQLHKDKKISGVNIIPTAFFALWGYWNLYFYREVNCWHSWIGGIFVVIANTIWVCQMIYYAKKTS